MKCNHCHAQWSVDAQIASQLSSCPFCGKPLIGKKQTFDTMEAVLREIIRLEGVEALRNGNRMISIFSDLAPHLTRERRVLRYFVECDGNTVFLNLRGISREDQRVKYQQVVYRMCNELYIAEKAVNLVCNSVWTALYGEPFAAAPENKQPVEQKPEKTRPPIPEKPTPVPTPKTPDAEDIYRQGMAYLKGDVLNGQKYPQDSARALPLLRQAADLGNVNAQQEIGVLLYNGEGIPCNYSEAAFWFRKAAEQGNKWGQYNLGQCYNYGRGLSRDKAKALSWYRKAAAQGYVDAQVKAGAILYNGEDVTRDYREAVIWFRKAAEQGDMAAQFNMGLCYEHGNGVGQSKAEALSWYRKSAAQGYADAQNKVGSLLYYGDGVRRDYREAAIWFRRAAEQGQKHAQYNLALCYINGH